MYKSGRKVGRGCGQIARIFSAYDLKGRRELVLQDVKQLRKQFCLIPLKDVGPFYEHFRDFFGDNVVVSKEAYAKRDAERLLQQQQIKPQKGALTRGIKRKLVDEFGARVAQITEERRSIASKQPVIGSEAAATALFYMVNRLEVTPADAVDLLNEKFAYYGDLKVVERFQTNSSPDLLHHHRPNRYRARFSQVTLQSLLAPVRS